MTVRKRVYKRKGYSVSCWVVDIIFHRPDGTRERIRKNSPVQTKRGAERYDREIREHLLRSSFVPYQEEKFAETATDGGQTADAEPSLKLEDFVPDFIETYARSNNKPSEVYAKQRTFKNHLLPFFGKHKLENITVKEVEAFKARKLKEGLAPKTINNFLGILGKALKTAVSWQLLPRGPEIKPLKLPVLEHTFLSFSESRALLSAIDSVQFTAMATIALRAGLRLGELRALRWQDVYLDNAKLVVRRAAWENEVGVPKSGKAREVALSPHAIEALRKLPRRGEKATVFCDADGKMLSKGACKWPLWRACAMSRLSRRIGWHVLRHTFASHLAIRGVALKIIQELLGHSDIKMTMRYAHLTPQVRHEAVILLDVDDED